MGARALGILAVVAGCTCGGVDPAPVPASAAPVAKAKGGERRAPVVHAVRFVVPVAADADPEAVRALLVSALGAYALDEADDEAKATKRKRPERKVLDAVSPWKCRDASVWPQADGAVTVWQRWADGPCAAAPDRWFAERTWTGAERPGERPEGAGLTFRGLVETHDARADGWHPAFESLSELAAADAEPGSTFPHDAAWLGEQLDMKLEGAPVAVRSERWALARLGLSKEPVTLLLERWSCAGGAAFGAAVSFETTRRAPGHDPNGPKDAVAAESTETFANAVRDALVTVAGTSAGGLGEVGACSR